MAPPSRHGRTVVGSIAAAALLAAALAVVAVVEPDTSVDWAEPGLLVSRDSGALYVVLDSSVESTAGGAAVPVLHPVINATSALLIRGSASGSRPQLVSQAGIDAQRIGSELGILGAPARVPSPARLIEDGWTACTGGGSGIRVTISTSSAELDEEVDEPATGGAVVRSGARFYLIAAGAGPGASSDHYYAYRLAVRGSQDALPRELRLSDRAHPPEVPADWIALFPRGGVLDAEAMGLAGAGPAEPEDIAGQALGSLIGSICARLGPVTGSGPAISLQVSRAPTPASATVAPGRIETVVDPGGGALVLADRRESLPGNGPLLIDAEGESHLLGPGAADRLGYAEVPIPVVPESWTRLLDSGVPLSVEAALCPPLDDQPTVARAMATRSRTGPAGGCLVPNHTARKTRSSRSPPVGTATK